MPGYPCCCVEKLHDVYATSSVAVPAGVRILNWADQNQYDPNFFATSRGDLQCPVGNADFWQWGAGVNPGIGVTDHNSQTEVRSIALDNVTDLRPGLTEYDQRQVGVGPAGSIWAGGNFKYISDNGAALTWVLDSNTTNLHLLGASVGTINEWYSTNAANTKHVYSRYKAPRIAFLRQNTFTDVMELWADLITVENTGGSNRTVRIPTMQKTWTPSLPVNPNIGNEQALAADYDSTADAWYWVFGVRIGPFAQNNLTISYSLPWGAVDADYANAATHWLPTIDIDARDDLIAAYQDGESTYRLRFRSGDGVRTFSYAVNMPAISFRPSIFQSSRWVYVFGLQTAWIPTLPYSGANTNYWRINKATLAVEPGPADAIGAPNGGVLTPVQLSGY